MPDGGFVASVSDCGRGRVLYRVPGGVRAVPIRLASPVPTSPADCPIHLDGAPSPSPDGTRLVFQHDSVVVGERGVTSLRMMDAASGAVTRLGQLGFQPRWSPTGDLIAFTGDLDERIWVMRPDGTGARPISPVGQRYTLGVSWSPDGRWLLAMRNGQGARPGWLISIINVTSGLELPLQYSFGNDFYIDDPNAYGAPDWSPVP